MKYIFTMLGIALVLTGCTTSKSTTRLNNSSEQITVFVSGQIVYVNDGF